MRRNSRGIHEKKRCSRRVRRSGSLGRHADRRAAGSPDPAGGTPAKVARKGRIKQGLWRVNFGADTKLSFDDMCREAARLGGYGFDLIDPADWPTLRKHGLEPLLAGAGP